MANPILTDKAFEQSARGGTLAPPRPGLWNPPSPADAAAVPAARTSTMTLDGVVVTAAGLFALLLVSAAVGWSLVTVSDGQVQQFPTWTLLLVLGGFGLVLLSSFKPHLSRFIAPVFAVAQGVFVGAISRSYETYYDGIVTQAVGATIAVAATMLVLYRARIIRVTERFRSVVMTATIGIAVFYGVSLLLRLFGVGVPFLQSASLFGIAFSVLVAGLAALNLLLDFDIIERGIQSRAPGYMNWFAALGLLVTLVWLYLELLRLLAKLRER
jgi:uncharacterized YccA/Bax inhibitor family protein